MARPGLQTRKEVPVFGSRPSGTTPRALGLKLLRVSIHRDRAATLQGQPGAEELMVRPEYTVPLRCHWGWL